MGGVDLLSRVVIPYSAQRRGVKWYPKLAELFLDIAVYNAYIVWKKMNPETKRKKSLSHLEFRKQLINDMITAHSFGMRTNGSTGPKNTHPLATERHFPSRYIGFGKKKNAQISCVVCKARLKRKDTRYMCSICNVGLCIIPCFELYHTKHNYKEYETDSSDEE